MAFDPALPANGSPLASQVMRSQFNALKDLIDAVPAGPPGPQGPPFAQAVVDGVSTGSASAGNRRGLWASAVTDRRYSDLERCAASSTS